MPLPRLEEVFKINGVPTYTFVRPAEYQKLIVNLRTPGRGLVVEGPSGIGKTSAIETALKDLGLTGKVTKLTPRKKEHIEYIKLLPEMKDSGYVIVDDFHRLPDNVKASIADHAKTLADEEAGHTKLIIIGINKAGERLIATAHDLANRLDIIRFESNPEHKVQQLINQGQKCLNIDLNVRDEIVTAAQGSFYIAQMLCHEVCVKANILEACENTNHVTVSFESIKSQVVQRLAGVFDDRCKRFCRGSKLRPEGRAPYLHILHWLAMGQEWTIDLRDAMRNHASMRGSVGQVVEKGYLEELLNGDGDLNLVLHYDKTAKQLTVEDPQFVFFIRSIPWNKFAKEVGYQSIDFKNRYDFALSFAGEDRAIAQALFDALQEEEFEVFYDANEQHRIAGEDVEEYLLPIYQSEAKYVLPLLSASYPKKIWTKIESNAFKERFSEGAVIPIRFADAPPGMFDEANKYGGLTLDPSKPIGSQISSIVSTLKKKMSN
jgi:hypothetical protein